MKVFDSIKNNKWVGKGMDIQTSSILVLKSANFSYPVSMNSGKYQIKIVGKKRTGSGKVTVEILTSKNDVLFREVIEFTKSSWSEKTFNFDSERNEGVASIKLSRERSVYGSIEIGRVLIDLISEAKPATSATLKHRRISGKHVKPLVEIPPAEPTMFIKAKVAIIIPYQIYGGAEIYLENIINNMPSNHKISLLYLKPNSLQNNIDKDWVTHRVIKNTIQIGGILESGNYDFIVYYNRADVYNLLVGLKKAGKIRSKLVEVYHSDFAWSGSLSLVKSREFLDKMIVITPSLGLDISGVKRRDIVRVGIDVDKFRKRNDPSIRESLKIGESKIVIGTVARLSKEKNIDYVLNLAIELKDYSFIIVGDGPERSRLQRRIVSEQIRNVHLVGHQKDVAKFYNTFDGFVLASRMEGTPISILEAMSSEVPVFTNMVGAISDIIIDGETGTKIFGDPKIDSDIISSSIHSLDIKRAAREFVVRNHDIEKTAREFVTSIFSINSLFEKNSAVTESLTLDGEYI